MMNINKTTITMKFLIFLGVIIATVSGLSEHQQWAHFKMTYAKRYSNLREEKLRFDIFKDNLRRIEEHNAKYESGEVSYNFGVNQFADMTGEEFMSMLSSQINNRPASMNATSFKANPVAAASDFKDWRDDGAVVWVKDQKTCTNGGWAFSTTGALEGQHFIINNELAAFSEQQLIDCNSYNRGCLNGRIEYGFEYVATEGICLIDNYTSYTGEDGSCGTCTTYLKTVGYKSVDKSEEALKEAVGTVGPIAIGVYANPSWQLYQRGIFDDDTCSSLGPTHAVLAVGYGSYGQDHWIIKNSWGSSWGEDGYIRLVRGKNQCGVSENAFYPLL